MAFELEYGWLCPAVMTAGVVHACSLTERQWEQPWRTPKDRPGGQSTLNTNKTIVQV